MSKPNEPKNPQLIIDRMKIRLEELQEQMPVIAELEAENKQYKYLIARMVIDQCYEIGYLESSDNQALAWKVTEDYQQEKLKEAQSE